MEIFLERLASSPLQEQIESIYLKGSGQDEQQRDQWSDIDLLIVLEPGLAVDQEYLQEEIQGILPKILAKQVFTFEGGVTLRLYTGDVTGIRAYDLQILSFELFTAHQDDMLADASRLLGPIRPRIKKKPMEPPSLDGFPKKEEDHNWFLFFETAKKFGRKDNLIGLHLYLDLVRACLVLQMKLRDKRKGTTIHRHGEGEVLTEEIDLTLAYKDDPVEKLRGLIRLSRYYHHLNLLIDKDYKSPQESFVNYIESAIKKTV